MIPVCTQISIVDATPIKIIVLFISDHSWISVSFKSNSSMRKLR